MIDKPECPRCARSLPGGRFNACPACGYNLRLSSPAAPTGSSSAGGRQQQAAPKSYSQAFEGAVVGTQPTTIITPMAASILHARAKKCRWLLLAFVTCVAVTTFAPALWEFWSYSKIRELVAQYGWANVPPFREAELASPEWLFFVSLIGIVASALLITVLTYQAAKVLYDIGILGLKWSPGWTVASFFVPFLFLYRPWVGLNELDRTLTGILKASPSELSSSLRAHRDFGLPTTMYGLLFFLSLIIDKILSAIAKDLTKKNVQDQFSLYQNLDSWEQYIIAELVSVIITVMTHTIYWNKIFDKMDRVAVRLSNP